MLPTTGRKLQPRIPVTRLAMARALVRFGMLGKSTVVVVDKGFEPRLERPRR
jgi:hypothetical protein